MPSVILQTQDTFSIFSVSLIPFALHKMLSPPLRLSFSYGSFSKKLSKIRQLDKMSYPPPLNLFGLCTSHLTLSVFLLAAPAPSKLLHLNIRLKYIFLGLIPPGTVVTVYFFIY